PLTTEQDAAATSFFEKLLGAPAPQPPQAAETPAPVMVPGAREKVKVSLLVPLTGKKADLGQAMLKAAQMALFDIGGADFELIPRDTKSTRDGAAVAAEAAVKNRDYLILGPVFSEDLKA